MGDQAQTRQRYLTGLVTVDDHIDRRVLRARGIARSHAEVTRAGFDGRERESGHPERLRVRLLQVLMSRSPTRRTELAQTLDTSTAVLKRELACLARAGIVAESVEDPDERPLGLRGRPPVYVSLSPGAGYALGIEIGTRALRVVVCDLGGAILNRRTIQWFPVDPALTIDRARELALHGLSEAGIDIDRVIG